jgi:hypothetical protein
VHAIQPSPPVPIPTPTAFFTYNVGDHDGDSVLGKLAGNACAKARSGSGDESDALLTGHDELRKSWVGGGVQEELRNVVVVDASSLRERNLAKL